jgi:ABC-2 type transport system permease protein
VRSGQFDALLLRPCAPLFALLACSARVNQLASLVVPAAALAAGCGSLVGAGRPRLWDVAGVGGVLLCAVAMQYAVGIASNAAALWIVRADELGVLRINAPNTAASYPLAIYQGWLRGYLTAVVPVGLACHYPVRFLLGGGGALPALAGAPGAAAAGLALALSVWRHGQARYTSTGT